MVMKLHQRSNFIIVNKFITVMKWGLLIKSINFALLIIAVFGHLDTFPGGRVEGWGKNKD